MNERIKELSERAIQLVADEHTNGDESRLNTDSYHVKDLINEKFAELIVLECARIGELKEQGYVYGPEYSAGHYMKQHFGVGNGNT
jgi:hypothetical protein